MEVFPQSTQSKDETMSSSNFGNTTTKNWTYDYKKVKIYTSNFEALAYKAETLAEKFTLLSIKEVSSNKSQKLINASVNFSKLANSFLDLLEKYIMLTVKYIDDSLNLQREVGNWQEAIYEDIDSTLSVNSCFETLKKVNKVVEILVDLRDPEKKAKYKDMTLRVDETTRNSYIFLNKDRKIRFMIKPCLRISQKSLDQSEEESFFWKMFQIDDEILLNYSENLLDQTETSHSNLKTNVFESGNMNVLDPSEAISDQSSLENESFHLERLFQDENENFFNHSEKMNLQSQTGH